MSTHAQLSCNALPGVLFMCELTKSLDPRGGMLLQACIHFQNLCAPELSKLLHLLQHTAASTVLQVLLYLLDIFSIISTLDLYAA